MPNVLKPVYLGCLASNKLLSQGFNLAILMGIIWQRFSKTYLYIPQPFVMFFSPEVLFFGVTVPGNGVLFEARFAPPT